MGAEAIVRRVVVPRRASIEAAARTARYVALEAVLAERPLAAMMLGHTARDQAETVLMRIVRGTGPGGLAGIPARRDAFVRPLLGLPRAAIDAYVARHGLPVDADPMNDDLALTRVRFRRALMPALRAENPQLDAALVRLAGSAAEWAEVIDAQADAFARLPIACAALASQPPAIRKRALSRALEAAGLDHDAVHLDQLDALVVQPPRGEVGVDLPGSRIVRRYDVLGLATAGGLAVGLAVGLCAPEGPYLLRGWQPGDRMRPARLQGRSRKLSDLYIDAKISRDLRATARVVITTADGAIVWAEHLGLAFGASENLRPRLAK